MQPICSARRLVTLEAARIEDGERWSVWLVILTSKHLPRLGKEKTAEMKSVEHDVSLSLAIKVLLT